LRQRCLQHALKEVEHSFHESPVFLQEIVDRLYPEMLLAELNTTVSQTANSKRLLTKSHHKKDSHRADSQTFLVQLA